MIAGLKPYPEMKDSDLPWLGAIPSHWRLERAKWLFRKMDRPVQEGDDVVTCFRDGVVTLRKNRRVRGFTESLRRSATRVSAEGIWSSTRWTPSPGPLVLLTLTVRALRCTRCASPRLEWMRGTTRSFCARWRECSGFRRWREASGSARRISDLMTSLSSPCPSPQVTSRDGSRHSFVASTAVSAASFA